MEENILTHEKAFELVEKHNGVLTADILKEYTGFEQEWFDEYKKGCFDGCEGLREIEIPEGIKEITYSCFRGCRNLQKVTLPSTLEVIGVNGFELCRTLNEINFPESLKRIDNQAFYLCQELKNIVINKEVSYIGREAFRSVMESESKEVYSEEIPGDLITYKPMRGDMTCRGSQYEVGKVYKKKLNIEIDSYTRCGFESCYCPFDCLNYHFGEYGTDAIICKCFIRKYSEKRYGENDVISREIAIIKKFDSYYEAFEDYRKLVEKQKELMHLNYKVNLLELEQEKLIYLNQKVKK